MINKMFDIKQKTNSINKYGWYQTISKNGKQLRIPINKIKTTGQLETFEGFIKNI